jgi:hypothetical protein
MNLLSGMQKRILACDGDHPAIHCQSSQAGGRVQYALLRRQRRVICTLKDKFQ